MTHLPGDSTASASGWQLWFALAAVVLVTVSLCAYGIGTWPMADDEVPSLVEMGLAHVDSSAFSVPASQIGKLPRTLPVWYAFQRFMLGFLPDNELGHRLPSLICAVLTIAILFLFAARWRGLWFAVALIIVVDGSQLFVFLSQVDRFYSMPLLLTTLTLLAILSPQGGAAGLAAVAVLTVLSVLSHNVVVVVFVLSFLAAVLAYGLSSVPRSVLWRSGVAAAISVGLYFAYIRPLVAGWNSTGNPTPVLVSFAAQAGIPTLALASLGSWLSLVQFDRMRSMLWWSLMFAGSLAFLLVARSMSWNPRYFLFFMPAMWFLAADAMEFVAARVGYRSIGAAWYACVILLLSPSLLSHFQDGTRHDYRAAARVLLANDREEQPILSDDAETISYYLPDNLRRHLVVRTKVTTFPTSDFFLVCRSNAWMPLCQVPLRRADLLAEISHRRFDQFSHILRVYRIEAAPGHETDTSRR